MEFLLDSVVFTHINRALEQMLSASVHDSFKNFKQYTMCF